VSGRAAEIGSAAGSVTGTSTVLVYSHRPEVRESIIEAYYAYSINKYLTFTADYQFVNNPAYNADRGPVSIFSGRLHGDF